MTRGLTAALLVGLLSGCGGGEISPNDCRGLIRYGNHPGLATMIKRRLNDPDSFDPIRGRLIRTITGTDTYVNDPLFRTAIAVADSKGRLDEGGHVFEVEFTAGNVFGGKTRHTVGGILAIKDCIAVPVTIDGQQFR